MEREASGVMYIILSISMLVQNFGSSSYKESRNNKPMYGYTLPNLSPSSNLYKVQSVFNNNVARDPYTRD